MEILDKLLVTIGPYVLPWLIRMIAAHSILDQVYSPINIYVWLFFLTHALMHALIHPLIFVMLVVSFDVDFFIISILIS